MKIIKGSLEPRVTFAIALPGRAFDHGFSTIFPDNVPFFAIVLSSCRR
jgi:hypothetical protein